MPRAPLRWPQRAGVLILGLALLAFAGPRVFASLGAPLPASSSDAATTAGAYLHPAQRGLAESMALAQAGTGTATVTPTATTTATATLTPTATTTLTPTPAVTVPQGRTNVVARVFLDFRCDTYFQTNVDVPLREIPVTLSFPNGASVTHETSLSGLVSFVGVDLTAGATISIDLPEGYYGYALAPCANSPTTVQLLPSNSSYRFVAFGTRIATEIAGP
jgi:hypothetical protein